MGRYSPGQSYEHRITECGGYYTIGWTVDFYYRGSRLRFPRRFSRTTDEAGARRFAKKWGVAMPGPRVTKGGI